ncbi:MAG: 1-deoxy-D-xylulose-5-phosphate reductoisomerase [Gammaproteobacteria bacterium]
MIGVTILGSTGSVGLSTLDVLSRHRDQFRLIALTANNNVDGLYQQCLKWQPQQAVMADEASAEQLRQRLTAASAKIEVLAGQSGLQQVAGSDETDYVMAAIVGAAGLLPTLTAARAGKRVLLANKEALVMSGKLFMDTVRDNAAELLPIDSEHNAVFQCMPPGFNGDLEQGGIRRIVLTASGGPFRNRNLAELATVTPEQACAHPNWDMGRKISVDSATMMNKGLELIEACWLFDTTPSRVEVVIHPQSIVHSLVEYADGSVLAQLGNPDMRTPIAHALAWPQRIDSGVAGLDLCQTGKLEFEQPDLERFPSLKLARQAMQAGGTATAILNAANEVAVQHFLAGQIRFTAIASLVEQTLQQVQGGDADSLDAILSADKAARDSTLGLIRSNA